MSKDRPAAGAAEVRDGGSAGGSALGSIWGSKGGQAPDGGPRLWRVIELAAPETPLGWLLGMAFYCGLASAMALFFGWLWLEPEVFDAPLTILVSTLISMPFALMGMGMMS